MFEIQVHHLVLLDAEEKDGLCDASQPYCHSAGVGIQDPLLKGVCATILSESRTLGFDVKTHLSVLLLGVVSFVISTGCYFSPWPAAAFSPCTYTSLLVCLSYHP